MRRRAATRTRSRAPRSQRRDDFDRAYTSGITQPEEGPASVLAERATTTLQPSAGPPRRPTKPAIEAGGAFALRGCVLTPDRVIEDGCVTLDDQGLIVDVSTKAPQGAKVSNTGGVILPGLIDLHGHPEFNIFAAWEPPGLFINRQQWRKSPIYHEIVRDPWNRLKDAGLDRVATRYAEVRALIGGTTAIQGATPQYPSEEALVRNVDKWIFGAHHARSMIDLPSSPNDELRGILQGIASGDVRAFYVHVAEGRHDNERSTNEFERLVRLRALTSSTVIIHGTALSDAQLGQVKDARAKLVWSPQSNLRLYGETTNAKRVLELNIPMALGADWMPSGSRSLLDEMRVARRQLSLAGTPVSAKQLVQMVTRGAASIAGLKDELGFLDHGRVGDVLVLERRNDDPWESVLDSDPSCVDLVLINGDLCYGRHDLVQGLVGDEDLRSLESVPAWGKPMVLDTRYAVAPRATPPQLVELRSKLIAGYPQVGPIFS